MENTSQIIENFEQILKKQRTKKPSFLYSDIRNSKKDTCRPQDVISGVSSQLKAIQSADCLKTSKCVNLNKFKKSCFLSVDKLVISEPVNKQNVNKFETQCVLDTQLIDVIKDAEALVDTHKGMTQEFDTSFSHIDVEKLNENVSHLDIQEKNTTICKRKEYEHLEHKNNLILQDINEFRPHSNLPSQLTKIDIVTNNTSKSNVNSEAFTKENALIINENIQLTEEKDNESDDVAMNIISSQTSRIDDIFQKSIEICNKDINLTERDKNVSQRRTSRSPSPVFNIKVINKTHTPPPLVFNLDAFEKFENIATPLIEDNIDLKMVKYLINSQLLGNELCLHTEMDNVDNRKLSPIRKNSDDNIKFDKTKADINNVGQNSIKNMFENETKGHNNCCQDEILFSSDEEYNFIDKKSQNLPFTCALETSTSEHSNSLDTIIYVGFQTASNKSIQVLAESFVKAKTMLSNSDDNIIRNEVTLSEMVKTCDVAFKNNKNKDYVSIETNTICFEDASTKDIMRKVENNIEAHKNDIAVVPVNNIEETESRVEDVVLQKVPEIKNIDGFKEESYKNVNLSSMALERFKEVFYGNYLEEKRDPEYDFNVKIKEYSSNGRIRLENEVWGKSMENVSNILPKEVLRQTNINDEMILQEFENIEMSFEDKKHKQNELKFTGLRQANKINLNASNNKLEKTNQIFHNMDLQEKHNSVETLALCPNKGIDSPKNEAGTIDSRFIGFKTASNKNIKISDDALLKTKNLFQDIEISEFGIRNSPEICQKVKDNNEIVDDFNKPLTSKLFIGFKTANNRDVAISDKALQKSKEIFKDINNLITDTEISVQKLKTTANSVSNISKQTVYRSKKLLRDTENTIQFKDSKNLSLPISPLCVFRTADNESVDVSQDALAKSKKMFDDLESVDKYKNDNKKNILRNAQTPVFRGFQTASNKKVTISDDALAKSKKIFDDLESIETLHNNNETNNFSNTEYPVLKGFRTASNKKVTISDVALAKSKRLFEDFDLLDNDTKSKDSVVCRGFQTASNQAVKISAGALAKSKKIFEDINDLEFSANNTDINNDKQLHTSGKDKLFSESDNLFGTKTIANTLFKGFQTANNNKVHISEQALTKSNAIFQDINLTSQTNKLKYRHTNLASDITKGDESEVAFKKSKGIFENLEAECHVTSRLKTSKDNAQDNVNIDNIINTQVINHFDETLCTEDFHNVTPKSIRSGSPILSCPKAKRRKFETPYRNNQIVPSDKKQIVEIKKNTIIVFDDNYKKKKKYTLKDLKNIGNKNKNITDSYISNFNFNNLLHFEFFDKRNDLTNNKINIENVKQLFVESVNENLIPDGWLNNHLQLIMWKLISYEIKFPKCLHLICTARNVINQLKYRYDRELYNAERPALRKILEKDDIASKTIILCVLGVYIDGIEVKSATNTNSIELLLTDGWYSIKASTDKMLAKLVCDEKITVGTKIVTTGAELVNCEQGVAPWEDTSSIRLKLAGNSTRRARWDARLGYHGNAAILTHLSNVKTDGGKVSKLRLFVTRVYPALYVEKFEDGSTVTRSERLEHLHQTKYEAERQVLLEKLYEQVEMEFSDWDYQDSEDISDWNNKRKCLDTGSQIAKIMKTCNDPADFKSNLTNSQVKLLEEHTNKRREIMLQDIQTKLLEKMEKQGLCRGRNVITLLKIRVAGVEEKSGDIIVTKGMLSIWKPNDAVLEIIREGAWIEVMNVVPTAIRYSEIQISAGRQSIFSLSQYKESDTIKLYTQSLQRKCYPIKDLTKHLSSTIDYNEIDTVGFVFLIEPSSKSFDSNKSQFQNVYMADADKNVACINMWGGLKKFGFENILDTGQIVACMNLQRRAGNTRKNITQYRATEFSYFTKTPKNINANEMVEELNKKLSGLDRRKFCDECEKTKNNFNVHIKQNYENVTPYRFDNVDLTKSKMFIDTPFGVKFNKKDDFNLTGLDFESTFKQTDSQELSPISLLRKRKVNEKITKLKMYGEPPPIAPLNIINKSENALNAYRSPLISKCDVSDSVATSKKDTDLCNKMIERNPDSPMTSLNRTFVKSSVNPVRLRFDIDNNLSNEVDHFAGDFDGSPPLSLD